MASFTVLLDAPILCLKKVKVKHWIIEVPCTCRSRGVPRVFWLPSAGGYSEKKAGIMIITLNLIFGVNMLSNDPTCRGTQLPIAAIAPGRERTL